MTREEININELSNFRFDNKIIIKGINNHFDDITVNTVLVHSHLSTLLGPFVIQAANDIKVSREIVIQKMALALKHTLAICDACNYDLPEESEVEEFENSLSYDIKMDSVLTLTEMIMCALDILHIINFHSDSALIWAEETVPDDFEKNIISIIIGIKNIGRKYAFTMKDVLVEM